MQSLLLRQGIVPCVFASFDSPNPNKMNAWALPGLTSALQYTALQNVGQCNKNFYKFAYSTNVVSSQQAMPSTHKIFAY